jgi:hypothetical protein
MSEDKVRFTIKDIEAAKESLAQSILRLPPEVQAWPKHVLKKGTDEEILKFANELCRP